MSNKIIKNVQKTTETGIITAAATVIIYVVCHCTKMSFDYLMAPGVVMVSAILGGLYNMIKHIGINNPFAKKV